MGSLIFLGLTFVAMYALLIRPQQRKVRVQRELLSSLAVGDEVVTAGGLLGTIDALDDDTVTLRVGDGSKLRFLRAAIRGRQPVFGATGPVAPDGEG